LIKTVVYLINGKLHLAQFCINNQSCKLIKSEYKSIDEDKFNSIALKNFIQKQGFAKNSVVSCFFRFQVGLRFYKFPSSDTSEIARMVDYEASEILPLKPEELVRRYLLLRKKDDGYTETLVVVTHKQEVLGLVQKLESIGLAVNVLNLSSFALFRCLQVLFSGKRRALFAGNLMLIYFEDNIVEIIIVQNGRLVFSRGFVLDESKKFSEVLVSEIHYSIDSFLGKAKEKELTKIIVSGYDVDLDVVANILKDEFDFSLTIEKRVSLMYGLALADGSQVNLLPDEFIARGLVGKLKKKLLVFLFLVILIVVFLGAIFFVKLNYKNIYLSELKQRMQELKPAAQAVRNKLLKVQMLKSQVNSQFMILDSITDLVKAIPDGCTLSTLSINEQGVLVIRGQAKDLQQVLDFVVTLNKSQYFKNSHLNYSSRRKVREEETLDFEIQSGLNKKNTDNES